MNIYHLTQRTVTGYDTYSDCIVIANSEEEARNIHPRVYGGKIQTLEEADDDYTWPKRPEKITATLIGLAIESKIECEVVCASFHAG